MTLNVTGACEWIPCANGIYYARFVGIKTSTPTELLEVKGGNIMTDGVSGATFKWERAGATPSTSVGISSAEHYGRDTKYLGTPDRWARVYIEDELYSIPCYSER